MKVTLLHSAQNEKIAEVSAAICVDKLDNPSDKGFKKAVESGHYSILEHLPLTFLVEDISRACSHQIVRHRIASYSQQSQRYAKVNTNEEWYVEPKSIMESDLDFAFEYQEFMEHTASFYQKLCVNGIPNEDARMVLPNACFTSVIMSMNARSFLEAATLRTCNKTQWEIKQVFKDMRECIKEVYPTIYELAVPNCYKKHGCLEAVMCKTPKSL